MHFYALAEALVMLALKLGIAPNVQLAGKYSHISAHIYASGNQALEHILMGTKVNGRDSTCYLNGIYTLSFIFKIRTSRAF
jgi:hypothetical protein